MEVAIYPDFERFFVPGTLDENRGQQLKLLKKDAAFLRLRLGLKNLDVILPEAPEVAEVFFQHSELTGGKKRLSGKEKGYYWLRTNTPTTMYVKHGRRFARVGWADCGTIYICGWQGSKMKEIGAARWMVPRSYPKNQ